ncbi:FAD binding domain-containing protein [Salipiger bermudensis]|uniref:Xanthine dehydrogenase family protein, medium subunit n=1 Tax=Salipiger bermudensis (strain DSM 26914 / JCM 13377 / KCTC 12554 / HTCC2601) TaxID=314265 RepID=Q0FN40_SALBH|nr:xanthine dehydrogenase family protein subunit M [Salipiger bermudensis]EAU45602.1 xanthine dehydrogenase family protein, medium subunit [Salipiger bermudensis HTCC2601]
MPLHRPESLDAALELLQGGRAVVLGGGTDLYPALRDGTPPPEMVDLTRIDGLRGISRSGDGWRIGGATTWTQVVKAELPPLFDGLKAAAREVGSVQIQNAGTVAGNLCNASPAADGVPALLALDAQVELAAPSGMRRMPLSDFITGPRATKLVPGEILTALFIPEATGQGAFLKLGARRYLVISIAMVSAVVEMEGDTVKSARLAVGACSPVARRLPTLEATLAGKSIAQAEQAALDYGYPELSPIDDVRAGAGYRREAVATLVARALSQAALTDKEVPHVA